MIKMDKNYLLVISQIWLVGSIISEDLTKSGSMLIMSIVFGIIYIKEKFDDEIKREKR